VIFTCVFKQKKTVDKKILKDIVDCDVEKDWEEKKMERDCDSFFFLVKLWNVPLHLSMDIS